MRIKKFLSAFLVCVMVVCAMSVTAFADEVFSFEELQDAINNAKDGEETEIVLGNDIVISGGNTATGLLGEGTEASPYLINSIDELKWFRDDVNAGNTYDKKYVQLNANIDLNNEEWTPIGYKGATFKGNFDGASNTIKNLIITKTLTNSSENNNIGFFGRTDSLATITNLTIENVNITGSLYVGAVVGLGYTGNKIENCIVKGNIEIDAWWYAGVIGGNGYMTLVNNCHVIGNAGSYIKGNNGSYIGGIWGFRGEGNNRITNCSVTDLNISGVDRVGGIAGIGHYGNTIANCSATKVAVQAEEGATTVGLIVGACQGTASEPTIFEGNDVSEVTAKAGATEVTGIYGTNISGGTASVTNYVAQIGDTKYATLAEALAAAKNGDTVELLADIEIDTETYTIADGVSITLDMNGKKITVTDKATVNYELFYIYGGLTVTGEGTIELASTTNRGWNAMSAIFHNRGGVLTIENGTFKNLGGTDMAWVVDNSGNSYGDAKTTVNGGTLASSYIAIRNRMDTYGANGGGNGVAHLVVNGGELSGKYAIWGHVSSKGAKGLIEIADGTFIGTSAAILVGEDNTGDVKTAISGGTYSSDVTEYLAEGFEIVENEDGTFGVAEEKPVLPTATVTKALVNTTVQAADFGDLNNVKDTPLTFQMNFKADEPTDAQREYYSEWLADYELVINKDVRGVDGYLAGQYDAFFSHWIKLGADTEDVVLPANKPIKIIKDIMGLELEYEGDILDWVKDFDCGIYLTPEFIEANDDLQITLALKLYNPENPEESYVIGEAYSFDADDAKEVEDDKYESLFLYVTYSDTYEDTNGNPDAYKLHLFAGIDSLKYSEVGFDVYYNGQFMMNCPTTTVYRSVTTTLNGVPDTKVYPTAFYNEANYIYGYTLYFDPDWDNLDIECKPYFVKLDGTKVPGYSFTINDVYPTTIEG